MTIENQPVKVFMLYGWYDPSTVPSLETYLLDSVDILSYWNHLPGLFMFKTRIDTVTLTAKLRHFFVNRNFMIAEVNPTNVNGLLPPPAWEWFRTPAPPYKTTSAASNSLARLFLPPQGGGTS